MKTIKRNTQWNNPSVKVTWKTDPDRGKQLIQKYSKAMFEDVDEDCWMELTTEETKEKKQDPYYNKDDWDINKMRNDIDSRMKNFKPNNKDITSIKSFLFNGRNDERVIVDMNSFNTKYEETATKASNRIKEIVSKKEIYYEGLINPIDNYYEILCSC